MSTYLELCQDFCLEADIAGGTAVPLSVTGQTGELARVVTWIKDAYVEIQNKHGHSWRWQKREFEVTTVASTNKYAFSDAAVKDVTTGSPVAITRFSAWHLGDSIDPPKSYLTAAGVGTQNWMIWAPWEWYRQIYKIGAQNDGYPAHITIDPQDNLVIGPAPNDVYTISGQYYQGSQVLTADGDVPEMPSQFHKLIVYRALEKYGYFESAQEVTARATKEGNRLMRQLQINQLARMRMRGPMA